MDFGIFNLMQQRGAAVASAELVDDAIRHTRIAESLGFGAGVVRRASLLELQPVSVAVMMVAHAAAATERIRLGTAVIVAPLHMPARLLGEIGLADSLSGGRLDLGIGNGYQNFEFERFHVDIDERRERLFEMLDIIELGLAEKVFEYRGHALSPAADRDQRALHPAAAPANLDGVGGSRSQCAHRAPRLRAAGVVAIRQHGGARSHPRAHRRIVSQRGQGRLPDAARNPELLLREREQARHRPVRGCGAFQQRIARSLRERREQVENDHSITPVPFAGEPSLDEIQDNILCGDPETVAEKLVEFIRIVHPTHMLFYFQVGGYESAKAIRSMELWAERVVPMLEQALGMPLDEIEGAPP